LLIQDKIQHGRTRATAKSGVKWIKEAGTISAIAGFIAATTPLGRRLGRANLRKPSLSRWRRSRTLLGICLAFFDHG
jgi:hypothetical protein